MEKSISIHSIKSCLQDILKLEDILKVRRSSIDNEIVAHLHGLFSDLGSRNSALLLDGPSVKVTCVPILGSLNYTQDDYIIGENAQVFIVYKSVKEDEDSESFEKWEVAEIQISSKMSYTCNDAIKVHSVFSTKEKAKEQADTLNAQILNQQLSNKNQQLSNKYVVDKSHYESAIKWLFSNKVGLSSEYALKLYLYDKTVLQEKPDFYFPADEADALRVQNLLKQCPFLKKTVSDLCSTNVEWNKFYYVYFPRTQNKIALNEDVPNETDEYKNLQKKYEEIVAVNQKLFSYISELQFFARRYATGSSSTAPYTVNLITEALVQLGVPLQPETAGDNKGKIWAFDRDPLFCDSKKYISKYGIDGKFPQNK